MTAQTAAATAPEPASALVDQAVGIIMARSGATSAAAVAQLAELARRTRRTLTEVAADLVGETTGSPVRAETPPSPDTVRLRPQVADLDRAADGDALAAALVADALGWSGAEGVLVAVLDGDAVLEIVGAHGFAAREVRRWRRTPPAVDTLLNRAVRAGVPVWLEPADADAPPLLGDPGVGRRGVRVAVPVSSGRILIGAAAVVWPPGVALGDRERREVEAIVQSVGPALLRTLGADLRVPDRVDGGSSWQDLVDLLAEPALVVEVESGEHGRVQVVAATAGPVRTDQADRLPTADLVLDLTRELAESRTAGPAATAPTAETAESPTLPTLPGLLAAVARTGAPSQHTRPDGTQLALARLTAGTVLVVPRPAGVADPRSAVATSPPAAEDEARLEQLARVGTWRWDAATDRARWSSEALKIVGSPALADPVPITRPPFTVHPDDADAERRFIKTLIAEGRPAEAEVRVVRYGAEPTRVRLAARPVCAADGAVTGVFGIVQDVTEWRRAEVALEVARVQLAAQRSRADAERQVAVVLQQMVVPAAVTQQPSDTGVEVAARYRPAGAAAGVGGDWYSVFPLRDAKLLLSVGDVAGHGLPAAAAMADLHHALRGMALTETGPGRLLTLLNELVVGMTEFTIASACCLLWDPETRLIRWANAGHPRPVRVRGGTAATLVAPTGPMLGADAQAVYEDCAAEVESGDVLLLYTDGLVERRRATADESTEQLLALAVDPEADLDRYADRILAGARSDTDDDVCVLVVRFA